MNTHRISSIMTTGDSLKKKNFSVSEEMVDALVILFLLFRMRSLLLPSIVHAMKIATSPRLTPEQLANWLGPLPYKDVDCELDQNDDPQVELDEADNIGDDVDEFIQDELESDSGDEKPYLPEWENLNDNQRDLAKDVIENPDKYKHCANGVCTCEECNCGDCAAFAELDDQFKRIEVAKSEDAKSAEEEDIKNEAKDVSLATKVDNVGNEVHASSVTMHKLFIANDPAGVVESTLTTFLTTNFKEIRVAQYAIAIEMSVFLLYAVIRAMTDPSLQSLVFTAISGVAYHKLKTIFFDITQAAWAMTGDKAKEQMSNMIARIFDKLPKPGRIAGGAAAVAGAAVAGCTNTLNQMRSAVSCATSNAVIKAKTAFKKVTVRLHEAKTRLEDKLEDFFPKTSCEFRKIIKSGTVTIKGILSDVWSLIQSPIKEAIDNARRLDELEKKPKMKFLTEQWLSISIAIVKALFLEPVSAMLMGFLYLEFTFGRMALKLITRGAKTIKSLLKPIISKI